MANNNIFTFNRTRSREVPVPSGTLSGVPLLINGRACVTLTARGDAVQTTTRADGSTYTFPVGGASNRSDSASVAYDGTWEFTGITGVTASTATDVPVYITSGNALTLTASGNTAYGFTDYPRDYVKATGKAPVRVVG